MCIGSPELRTAGVCELLMPDQSITTIRKVMDGMVLTTDVTKVGDVYFKLAKYMLRAKLTLFFINRKSLNLVKAIAYGHTPGAISHYSATYLFATLSLFIIKGITH
ncbi:hypothetical protein TB2_035185 [Malus domestica]